jgi:hypothetical protein
MICIPVENLSNRKLDAIMPGIGGMVRPYQCLFQVVRGFVIELPAKGHQVIPVAECFLISGFNVINLIFPPDLQSFISVHALYCL